MDPKTRKANLVEQRGALCVVGRFHCSEVLLPGAHPFVAFRARTAGLAGFDRAFAVKCLGSAQAGPPSKDARALLLDVSRRMAGLRDPRIAQIADSGDAG